MAKRTSSNSPKQPEKTNDSQVKIAIIGGIVAIISVLVTTIIGPVILKTLERAPPTPTMQILPTSTLIPSTPTLIPPPPIEPNVVELGSINCGRQENACGSGSPIHQYSHVPPVGKIIYTLTVDDLLDKVELVCDSSRSAITELFTKSGELSSGSGTFPIYKSDIIQVPSGCRVNFTLINTIGDVSSISLSFIIVP